MAPDREPALRIRPGMDVFDEYQDRFIGSVVRVFRQQSEGSSGARRAEKETAVQDVPLTHEEGQEAGHARVQGSKMLGEEMGPAPTIAAGNTGPVNQSAEHDYATRDRPDSEPGAAYFAVRPGRINLGLLTRPLYIPTSAISSISMERIILNVREIPKEWHHPPTRRTPRT